MAAGKSTLAKRLADSEGAVLLAQDELLEKLFEGEVVDLAAFVKYSGRVQAALGPHVISLLSTGMTVVLDFPANTKKQRAWFRQLIEQAGAEHELHLIVASDELCKRQLKQRSESLGQPAGTKWTTEADFDEVTAYFDPPAEEERFRVIRHDCQAQRHESYNPMVSGAIERGDKR
jgi:predicted kinase